jgi:bifunctional DNA-binding transcriptional regulator/antitoxin component of YhaV-PrlF toxin-antitoxin module
MSDRRSVPTDTLATTYQVKVAEENGQTVLVFPSNMLEDLGWTEGDTIVWDIRDDAIVVRQLND